MKRNGMQPPVYHGPVEQMPATDLKVNFGGKETQGFISNKKF